jgi:hypothetical protein
LKGTNITKAVRAAVLKRDSFDGCPCCIYCGQPFPDGRGAHLHHIERRSQGGQGSEDNLVTLCFDCHTALHNGHSEIQDFCKAYLDRKEGVIEADFSVIDERKLEG